MIEYKNGFLLEHSKDRRLCEKRSSPTEIAPSSELKEWLRDHDIPFKEPMYGTKGFLLEMRNPEHRTLFKLAWGGGVSNAS